jgi:uncharacterized metal-binding protein
MRVGKHLQERNEDEKGREDCLFPPFIYFALYVSPVRMANKGEEGEEDMTICANCGSFACIEHQLERTPPQCPMNHLPEIYDEALQEYQKPEIGEIARNAAMVEGIGYGIWTRLEEIIEFSWRMNFRKLGLVFCHGLRIEARKVAAFLKKADFEVISAGCKTGSKPKELLGIEDRHKIRPGQFEPMCNPIAQAKILNKSKTDLNILMGLCVGHDTLFIKYLKGPLTVLAVKDRVLAHNPLGAIYAEFYFAKKLASHKKPNNQD